MADYWLLDKTVVHKLFKVLVPRFENCPVSATRMFKAPREYPVTDVHKRFRARSVLELRGHPYPPIQPNQDNNRYLIHNVLLDAAKKDFAMKKQQQEAEAKTAETVARESSAKTVDLKQ